MKKSSKISEEEEKIVKIKRDKHKIESVMS